MKARKRNEWKPNIKRTTDGNDDDDADDDNDDDERNELCTALNAVACILAFALASTFLSLVLHGTVNAPICIW